MLVHENRKNNNLAYSCQGDSTVTDHVAQSQHSSDSEANQITFRRTALARSISAAVLASVAGTAAAQQIEEITVTATKRAESIQDVPLAITAFTGDFVKDVNLDDVKDLVTFTPGVTGNSHDSFIDAISIRGVRTQDFGIGGDPSAAFFKNNLYEGRNGAVISSLYDMERAEVLRGPQGFLFGRNAAGGAFSVHTKRPNLDGSTDGYVELDAGERGHFTLEGGFTAALSDTFAVRLAGYHSQEDGYVRNAFNPSRDLIGHDKSAFRLSGLYATDRMQVFFSADYEDQERDGSVYRPSEVSPFWDYWQDLIGTVELPANPRDANLDLVAGNNDDAKSTNLGLHVDYDFDKMSLSWSAGFKDHDYLYNEDYDGTPINAETYRQDQKGDYLQTEIRLTSNTDGPLSWYAGVSYYKEDIDVNFLSTTDEEVVCAYYGYYYGVDNCADYFDYWQAYFDAAYYPGYITVGSFVPSSNGRFDERNIVNGRYNGWAAYVDLSYQMNEQWDVSLGLRYNYDEKKFTTEAPRPASMLQNYFLLGYMTEPLTDKNDWSELTPRLIVRYIPNSDTTLFASYTEGYKSGGFGTFSLNPPIFQWFGDGPDELLTMADGFRPAQFRPEEVKSYEVGYKGLLADGTAQLDVTAFVYEYNDLQVNFFDQGARVGNAGSVDGLGLEATLQWAINENFNLVASAGYLDTEATGLQFLCGGDPDADGFLDGNPDGCEGSKLFWAPDISGSMLLKGNFPTANGAIVGNIEMFFETERGRGYEDIVDSDIDAYQEWALRLGYESDNNWNLTAYVENLTDELTWDGAANNGGIIPPFYFGPSRPRTAGLRFGYYFE
ncbi:MAG: TonB-dependent receptor [Woeseiaceae bacterium]|nr:TonB-dependent receptor [Woeseiaceae bacterium]